MTRVEPERPPPLPDLQDQVLDDATVAALFRDLALVAVLEVRLKAAPGAHVLPGTVTLAEARAAWESGAVRGVQVRYGWEGRVWFDTLLRTPAGARLVRMQEPT